MSREQKSALRRFTEGIAIALLLPILLPLIFTALTLLLYLVIWCVWLPNGKNALVVYSESPIWRNYMVQEVLPLLGNRAIVLNWSERMQWPKLSLAVHVFRTFGGPKEFNPMVVLFRPLRSAKFFRFWPAFKEWKNGHTQAVDSLRQELGLYVDARLVKRHAG